VAIGDTKGHDEAKLRVTNAGWKAARPFWAKPEPHRRRRFDRLVVSVGREAAKFPEKETFCTPRLNVTICHCCPGMAISEGLGPHTCYQLGQSRKPSSYPLAAPTARADKTKAAPGKRLHIESFAYLNRRRFGAMLGRIALLPGPTG